MTTRAVSKHIGVLEAAGLVTRGRDAQRRPSRIRAEPLANVDMWLQAYRRLWTARFDRRMNAFNACRREMPVTKADDPDAAAPNAIVTVRLFDAPRELVFRNWIEAEHVQTWFAPDSFTITSCEVEARPGGRWRVEYRSERGSTYVE